MSQKDEIQLKLKELNDLYEKEELGILTEEEYNTLLVQLVSELYKILPQLKIHNFLAPEGTVYFSQYIDGEEIHVIKNPETNQMSNGFTKKQAIENYILGKTFDATEYEEELESLSL